MRKWVFIFLCITSFCACQSNGNQETGAFDAKIEGAVSYRDKSTIPPSSIIKVALLDLSAGEPKVINQAEYRAGETSVPYAFSIPYNKSAINPEGTYALNGEISFAGQNLYYTLKPIEVFNTTLKNNVALILVKGPKPNN